VNPYTVTNGALAIALAVSKSPVVYGEIFSLTAAVSVLAPAGGTPAGTVSFQLQPNGLNPSAATPIQLLACSGVASTGQTYTCTTSASSRGVRPSSVPADLGLSMASDTAMPDLTAVGLVGNFAVSWSASGNSPYSYTTAATTVPLRVIKANTTVALSTAAAFAAVAANTPALTAVVTVQSPGAGIIINDGVTPANFFQFQAQQISPQVLPIPQFATFAAPTITITPNTQTAILSAYTAFSFVATPATTTGSYNERVNFLGDRYLNPSTSNVIPQNIVLGTTTTGVLPSANPSVVGQTVTYIATVTIITGVGSVSNPTATVTFFDNGVIISTCSAQTVTSISVTQANATCSQTYQTVYTNSYHCQLQWQ